MCRCAARRRPCRFPEACIRSPPRPRAPAARGRSRLLPPPAGTLRKPPPLPRQQRVSSSSSFAFSFLALSPRHIRRFWWILYHIPQCAIMTWRIFKTERKSGMALRRDGTPRRRRAAFCSGSGRRPAAFVKDALQPLQLGLPRPAALVCSISHSTPQPPFHRLTR